MSGDPWTLWTFVVHILDCPWHDWDFVSLIYLLPFVRVHEYSSVYRKPIFNLSKILINGLVKQTIVSCCSALLFGTLAFGNLIVDRRSGGFLKYFIFLFTSIFVLNGLRHLSPSAISARINIKSEKECEPDESIFTVRIIFFKLLLAIVFFVFN